MYQHSCHNTSETGLKAAKSKEKMDSIKGAAARRKKAEEKYKEVRKPAVVVCSCTVLTLKVNFCMQRQKQFKIQKHLLLKNRNDYLLGIARCNALSGHYFSADIKELIEVRVFMQPASHSLLTLLLVVVCRTWTLTIMMPSCGCPRRTGTWRRMHVRP